MTASSTSLLRHVRQLVAARAFEQWTDRQLLERFTAGRDEAAFTLLVRRHGPMVLGLCRRLLGHEQDAEDAFQAAFLLLARKAGSIRQADVGGWLYRVAYHAAVRARLQRDKRQPLDPRGEAMSPTDPPTEAAWNEMRQVVDEELQRLPEDWRAALVLCHLEGKTQEEAARLLGWSKGTLRRRLERGRELLRHRLLRRGLAPLAALTASLLAESGTAAVPPLLAGATIRAAVSGTASPAITPLVEAGAALWSGSKAKAALVLLLAASLLGGAGAWTYHRLTAATPAQTAEPPAAKAEDKPRTTSPQRETRSNVDIQGRVLGPDSKPLAGAKVYYYFITRQEEPLPVRAATDAQGRFAFTLTPKDIPLSADALQADPRKMGLVIVKADGFTFAWRNVIQQQTDLTLHVAADDTPLTGRFIDLEGKPLAGLHVTAWSAAAPEKGDLTPFVQALQARESFLAAYRQHLPNRLQNPFIWRPRVPLLPAATTDAQGRFRLPGFAPEQLVELRIEGPAIETQNLYVLTGLSSRDLRSLLSAPRNKDPIFGPGEPVVVLANGFDHPLPPGLTVAGTVRDADTKRPIPRAIIESYVLAGTKLAQNTIYHTIADDQGRYRFSGLPRGKGNRIRIRPPADQPYIPVVKEVPAVKLFTEAAVDAALNRGVWVDVTTVDKNTGEPVTGSVSYFVLPEKPAPERPFEQPFANEYDNFMAVRNDGTFRFVAVPRRAILAFRADGDKYPIAREAATIHFPFGISASNFQAFAEIDPKPDEEPVKVKFVLDVGHIVQGKVLDPEGRPLAGALAAGLRHDWFWGPDRPLKTADFTVLGLQPDRPRLLCFVHEERKLAGSIIVRGDEKAPVTVKLQPWASVAGRLLDAAGKPIPNATLQFTEIPVRKPGQPMSLDTGLHVITRWAGKPSLDPRTDEQGRFRVDRLVPGLQYNLALMNERGASRFEQIKWQGLVFRKLILKPGEAKELGDVKLQPFPSRDRQKR